MCLIAYVFTFSFVRGMFSYIVSLSNIFWISYLGIADCEQGTEHRKAAGRWLKLQLSLDRKSERYVAKKVNF